jgi:hypothetical protein
MTTCMRRWISGAMSVAVLGAVSGAAAVAVGVGGTTAVTATLTAKKEVPTPAGSPKGTGTFTGTVGAKRVLTWKLTFRGLTGPAAGAHIHLGRPGKAGPVAIVLCGTVCRSPMTGRATLTAVQLRTIRSGGAYVNVHTRKNPGGEIRGQVALTG